MVSDVGGGKFMLINGLADQCLHVAKARRVSGSKVVATTCDAKAEHGLWKFGGGAKKPKLHSSWSPQIGFGIVPVSAALVPSTTRVRLWSGSLPTNFQKGAQTYWTTYDWKTGQVGATVVEKASGEIFCQGAALDADGAIAIAGGSTSSETFSWAPSGSLARKPKLNVARGYNSLVTLPSGSLFTLGGSWNLKPAPDKIGEVLTPGATSWRPAPGISAASFKTKDAVAVKQDNHMWLFATGGASIFHAGPSRAMHWIDAAGSGSVSPAGTRGSDGDAMNGNAVMFAEGKILTTGGAPSYTDSPATNTAHLIDVGTGPGSSPKVTQIKGMIHARAYHNSVLLPDGRIAIIGGQKRAQVFVDMNSVLTPELFDPDDNSFSEMAGMSVQRNYHSVAILLPDATVLAAGGGLCGTCKSNHPNGQILSPPYLFDKDGKIAVRPVITSGPAVVKRGATITVTSPDGEDFVLVRMSTVTHTTNTDQRRFELVDEPGSKAGEFRLKLPSDEDGFVPGAYMLFAFNAAGTPSIARTMLIQ
jgi:galactose oxidase